ncbi:hypothetical protein NDA01_27170 [Trichocoleus desertorum AS-A10]|uniref:hypothetical protein n=1 Tax=Trichocoleus desertorum TaxID=1481672 RepID=UPI003297D40F
MTASTGLEHYQNIQDRSVPKIYDALPKVLEKIEAMIETYRRFGAYQSEVQAIAQLGISFQEWLQLKPTEAQPEGAKLMYIMPSEPLKLISVN